MKPDLSAEALEYGRSALRAFESAGGDRLLAEAEADPERRATIDSLLAGLGAWDLHPAADADELEAAAALCRSSGYWGLPYPVAQRLCRTRHLGTDALAVVAAGRPAAPAAGLELRWEAVDLDGRLSRARVRPPSAPPRYSAFVVDLDLDFVDELPGLDIALGVVLPCWTLLGMLDRALDLTRGYVLDRRQFGQPLAAFLGVQFQLTEAEVERLGVEELAKYALWSVTERRPNALEDALALRLAAIEAADVVFRVAHQLHGAIGFCDETTLSWLSRYSIPLRRLPTDLSATRRELVSRLGSRPLDGIFSGAASGATGAA